MRRTLPAALAALALLSLAGCGGTASSPAASSPAAASTPASTPAASLAAETTPPAASVPAEPEPPDPIRELMDGMTLEEKAGQLFFVRCPTAQALEDVTTYHLGGYLLFTRDFQDAAGGWLTAEAFTSKIGSWQEAASIPLLIGVDEEGGSVVRASLNPNLFPEGKFHSPQWLDAHACDGGDIFAGDAREKSRALLGYGINVNLAPVCDVATGPGAFIYDRTLGKGAEETADYAASVAGAMADSGIGCVLKHFPGYGNNADTHTGIAVDNRPLEEFESADLLPFRAGLAAGGDRAAVLVSHNIVTCLDETLPASLSPAVHKLLREGLGFDGVAMTDDLAMDAVRAYAKDGAVAVMALQAGNDLVITTDYRTQIPKVIEAAEDGTLDGAVLDGACYRVLKWKEALGLIG